MKTEIETSEVLALENELALDNEGWALLAPFGEHRKTRAFEKDGRVVQETYVQIFDEAAVDAVVANEQGSGLFGRIKRALIKRPIYNGHPDIKLYAPDTVTLGNDRLTPLGVNDGCRKTARGLEFKPLLVPAGAKAVEEDGCKYPSGLFLLRKTGKVREDGAIEVRPFKLASIGLTPCPNISGVDSLANQAGGLPGSAANGPQTTTKGDTEMKQLLIGWLAAQGIALANDATEQAVFDAFMKENQTRVANVTALGNEKSTLTSTVQSLTAERDAAKKLADETAVALANEQTAFKAERQGRIEAVVDLVIGQGRMDVASRDAKVTELLALGNDKLTGAMEELRKQPVKFQVTGSQAGAERKEESNPKPAAIALANEVQALVKGGKSRGQALDEVIKAKPELYKQYRAEGGALVL